jgi:riboflavin kinase/FMN adenylyltransferase
VIPLLSPHQAKRPTAIALGSFDGLHRGHRRVIDAVSRAEVGVPTVVSFWPHPREVLFGETRLRLDLPREKLALLEPLGIRQLVLVPFDRELAMLSPDAFVARVLVKSLDTRRIAVGRNFRFGVGRSGDAEDLARLGAANGIEVIVCPTLEDESGRLSSSRIRTALAAGRIEEARGLLERPYRFSGQVVQGRGLGRQLGWPTANLRVDGRKFLPMEGVYAAWVRCGEASVDAGEPPLPAVMNLGPQPTIDPDSPSAVEVHLLEGGRDLLGRWLTVEPRHLLRRQQRFASGAELATQIGADARRARHLLEAESDRGGDAAI